MVGDRECPECEEVSLVEYGLDRWKCLLCEKIYNTEWLDGCED